MVRLYSDASYHKDDGPDVAKIGRPVFNLAFLHTYGLSNVFQVASICFVIPHPIFAETPIHAKPGTDSDSVRSPDHNGALCIGVGALS